MKINEVCSPLKTYIATVRVVFRNGSTTARTSIQAESTAQAFALLSHIYGVGHIFSLSEVVHESVRACQIQAEATITSPVIPRHAQPQKVAQKANPLVQQRQRRISSRPVPAQVKHDLVQDRLTQQFMRQSNIVKPTADDVRIARDRAETKLKRADLNYQRAMKRGLR